MTAIRLLVGSMLTFDIVLPFACFYNVFNNVLEKKCAFLATIIVVVILCFLPN